MEQQANVIPHVIMLPFPLQGHIKPMLNLAELLCSRANFHVTFLNSHHNHNHFLRVADMSSLKTRLPGLHFQPISDGLPHDHPRAGPDSSADLFFSTRSATKPLLRQLLKTQQMQPITCIIADGFMSFAIDVAEELCIPVITFHTQSACSWWVHFHLNNLIRQGELPFQGEEDMDKPIPCIPGLENFFRRRDLPSICRFEETDHPIFQFFISEILANARSSALILNTFEQLEAPLLSRLGSFLTSKIYPVGPLHALLKSCIRDSSSFKGILWKEDRTCMMWLDSQPLKSVLYVSFGSLMVIFHNQLLEFWHGLINSGKRFLWVIRPDMIIGKEDGAGRVPIELEEGTKGRGCIVTWAPQEMVLAHPAVGGFLTHGGWNSTMESIFAGVPMICWPTIADQQVNSRCVSELWRIGFDMKDTCDRSTIEKLVRDLMEDKRDEIMKSTDEIARIAHNCVQEGGSSYCNLDKLIQHIRTFN